MLNSQEVTSFISIYPFRIRTVSAFFVVTMYNYHPRLLAKSNIEKQNTSHRVNDVCNGSFLGTATVMMTICGAVAMSYWMNAERIPNMLAQMIVRSGISATGFNMLVVLILLIMGMFMTSGITIMTPLLVPIASALNIVLILFGMVMVFTLGIGNMSPPFGIVLYQVSSLLDMKLERLVKASFPFLVLMVGCAVLYALVPWFSTWLPAVLYG